MYPNRLRPFDDHVAISDVHLLSKKSIGIAAVRGEKSVRNCQDNGFKLPSINIAFQHINSLSDLKNRLRTLDGFYDIQSYEQRLKDQIDLLVLKNLRSNGADRPCRKRDVWESIKKVAFLIIDYAPLGCYPENFDETGGLGEFPICDPPITKTGIKGVLTLSEFPDEEELDEMVPSFAEGYQTIREKVSEVWLLTLLDFIRYEGHFFADIDRGQ